jgi:pyruvate kinase
VDAVAVSFVLGHEDVERVKEFLRRKGVNIPVIAKVEKPEALKNIDSILDSADGIMVARGDLGVEVAPQEVPVIQKNLIRKANESRKLVITATQMLESMREHLRPTRAEATDVANSVLDGTDALMLSAETSIGKYPIQAVRMMGSIVETTERRAVEGKVRAYARASATHPEDPPSNAIAEAAVRASSDVGAKSIAAFTRTGFTALLVSKCRPVVPVIAFTPDETVIRRMSFFWGVSPLFMRLMENTDKMVSEAERVLVRSGILNKGDLMVVVASSPLHAYGRTNFLKIHKVGRGG